jgi:hypothetical protein
MVRLLWYYHKFCLFFTYISNHILCVCLTSDINILKSYNILPIITTSSAYAIIWLHLSNMVPYVSKFGQKLIFPFRSLHGILLLFHQLKILILHKYVSEFYMVYIAMWLLYNYQNSSAPFLWTGNEMLYFHSCHMISSSHTCKMSS